MQKSTLQSVTLIAVAILSYCNSLIADDPVRREEAIASLRLAGISANQAGIEQFLRRFRDGQFAVLDQQQLDALIQQLGSAKFQNRQQAERQLQAALNPPLELLRKATNDSDPEIATRVRRVLANLRTRPDPRLSVYWLIVCDSLDIDQDLLIETIRKCTKPEIILQAQQAYAGRVTAADVPSIRRYLTDPDVRVRGAAILGLARAEGERVIEELVRLLESSDKSVHAPAAIALVELGADIDWSKYEELLDRESLARVLGYQEARFRKAHVDDREKTEVRQEHQKLLQRYADTLAGTPGVVRETRQRANTLYWLMLGLDTSKHPEILIYRVRWFSGKWSPWLVPGYNDREKDKGRNIRIWANFNDHPHEVIYATDRTKYRKVADLP